MFSGLFSILSFFLVIRVSLGTLAHIIALGVELHDKDPFFFKKQSLIFGFTPGNNALMNYRMLMTEIFHIYIST